MTAAPAISSDDYRRQARQLRARHRGDSATLITSLRDLAIAHDRETMVKPTVERVNRPLLPPSSPSVVEHFGTSIRERLQGQFISYSDRLDLFAEASRLGIGRFEANLMIAAVQHTAEREIFDDVQAGDVIRQRGTSTRSMLLFAATVQASIALFAYRLLIA